MTVTHSGGKSSTWTLGRRGGAAQRHGLVRELGDSSRGLAELELDFASGGTVADELNESLLNHHDVFQLMGDRDSQ